VRQHLERPRSPPPNVRALDAEDLDVVSDHGANHGSARSAWPTSRISAERRLDVAA
jgi:hypothetical protein